MVGVPVRDDDRAQLAYRHLEHVEVAGDGVRCQAGVVEHGLPVAVPLEGDQGREPVLGNQLVGRTEVGRLVAS